MKTRNAEYEKWLAGISPILIAGVFLVLLPVFGLMTVQHIQRQKENSTRLMLEKGAALIRSFEAGTRTGMMGKLQGQFKLQSLITETAQQPDIEYILVTDPRGVIFHADNRFRIGNRHGEGLDLKAVGSSEKNRWRIIPGKNGSRIFEVFRKFSPLKRPLIEPPDRHAGGMMMRRWSRFLHQLDTHQKPETLLIFIGLDMSPIEAARRADTRHILFMGVAMLLVGFSGIVLIFFFQSYRSARSSLSRIRAFSDQLVENLPLGLIALDPDARIAAVNQFACSLLGLTAEKATGAPAEQYLPADITAQFTGLEIGEGTIEKEIDCVLEGDRFVPLQLSISRMKSESGSHRGVLILFKDMSRVRALENEIARSQRLASVGKLAAGVAHEIRNPLSSIKGFATYFQEKYRDVAEDQHIAVIMIQEVDRLNRVVNQLLEFARPIPLNAGWIDVRSFIEDTIKLAEKKAEKDNIDIRLNIFPGIEKIRGDADRLNQVLLNLYLNAIEAMDGGGTLRVDAEPDPHGRGAWIHVSDTGNGIFPEDLSHVFDPYFTTKPGGTGLGLAIAHNIVEAHKGQIKMQSRPGTGTTVSVFLPDGKNGDGRS